MTMPLAGGGAILAADSCLPLTVPAEEWQKCIERARLGQDTVNEAGLIDWVITPYRKTQQEVRFGVRLSLCFWQFKLI